MPDALSAIVMAAGKSTRFKSQHSKLAHPLLGKSIIERVIETLGKLSPQPKVYVVVGHCGDEVRSCLTQHSVLFVVQEPQLGTGHCVQMALNQIPEQAGRVLIINGDIPLISVQVFQNLLDTQTKRRAALTLVSTRLKEPAGYGRVLKNRSGQVMRVVEDRDATPAQRRIREINVGIYAAGLADLKRLIPRLSNQNAQQEYYLTDLIEIFNKAKKKVATLLVEDSRQVLGANDRAELAALEQILRETKLLDLMRSGITLIDPRTTSIDEDVQIGADTVIYPGVRIEGRSTLGSGCVVRSHSRITNSIIEDDVIINDLSVINESHVARGATIGPFTHLRLNAEIGSRARVGNFVEVKKTKLGKGAKASHLTYLGDAFIGDETNVGAGTITCNYDGETKNQTVVGEGCFIGSGVELVAPVTIGAGAYVAAGSVVTEDVPPQSLAVARSRQVNKLDWKKKRKREVRDDSKIPIPTK
ncbi:MAG: bifunctional UDP-N-acetylglucosamine diphosphorylase/glucosamine-1-phosphate N-acetyltransferase GlmU [Acidobacteriia bacterium]|nr:bifunctional UDP-N-acetylglucosamine diphosphorylase/glucosamine-1-phosphate N-acetyltransferase GlmU [Terriglobia bacterium]